MKKDKHPKGRLSPSEVTETRTIHSMLMIFCNAHHHREGKLCDTCQDIFDYATVRVSKCPIREAKPPCENCHIHCYKNDYRESVKTVMRYAGPHMIYRHPLLALNHLFKKILFRIRQKKAVS